MEDQTTKKPERQISQDQANAFIQQQIMAGAGDQEIINALVEKNISNSMATMMVESARREMVNTIVSEEKAEGPALLFGALGGLAAAIVGAIVWAAIAIYANYEIGLVAWGIGVLAGFGVVLFSGGKKGITLQVIAIVSALLGIVLGKYAIFWDAFKKVLAEEMGPEAAAQVALVSINTFITFLSALQHMVSFYDVLWIALAVASAWKIPSATIKVSE